MRKVGGRGNATVKTMSGVLSHADARARRDALGTAIARLLARGPGRGARRTELFDTDARWQVGALRNLLSRGLVTRSTCYWIVEDDEGLRQLCGDKKELQNATHEPSRAVPHEDFDALDAPGDDPDGSSSDLDDDPYLSPRVLQESTLKLFNVVLNVAQDLCNRMDRIEACLHKIGGRLQIDLGAGVPDETPLDAPLDEPPLDVPSLDAPLDETSPRSDGRIGT